MPLCLHGQVAAIGRAADPMSLDLLVANLRDDMVSNMIVMFLRLVTSAELQRREDFFAPFIMVGGRPAIDVPRHMLVWCLCCMCGDAALTR